MVKILSTGDAVQWRSYLDRLPPELLDIHFYPEMMLPYEATNLGKGMLVVDEQGDDFLIHPYLEVNETHLRHPYNFGGPIATAGYNKEYVPFTSIFTLNPFFHERQNQLIGNTAQYVKDTVWLDLTKPFKIRQTTRHLIEKADAGGVKVAPIFSTPENISLFYLLYTKHMEKVGAAQHWKFPQDWFSVLLHVIGINQAILMFAKEADALVGACLLIFSNGTCYYHFAASSFRAPRGTSHRMVMSAAEYARDNGFKKFHLGGGLKPNDGLFTFKAGFSDLRLPVLKYESV